ncbi:DNA replication factor C, large subunit [Myriangium duriaei CBS 260.36]|uniref:Replication factor C subunit 1 n=1 Tax=Myriangium duriaei CBS 260.36 TaxID=1168546 RepID=A0A9P4J7T0_9PEZI|nr:DNA replication factor C, large subunit [Myriangium duriaei CBS 260.36]
MPSDIRSFFGGKPPPPPIAEPKAEKPPAKKGRGARKVVQDDSDEEELAPKPKKSSPVKAAKRARTPEGEATTTSEYFGNIKPKRSEPVRSHPASAVNGASPVKTPVKANGTSNTSRKRTEVKTPSKSTPGSARSTRTKSKPSYADDLDVNDFPDDLEEDDFEDMPKSAKATAKGKKGTAKSTPSKTTSASTRSKRSQAKDSDYAEDEDVDMHDNDPEDDFVVPDEDEGVKSKSTKEKKAAASNKRKATELDEEEDDAESSPKKRGRKASGAASKKKAEPVEDSAEIKAIMSSIPTVRAPTPPPRDEDGKVTFDWKSGPKNTGAPPGQGSKEVPEGAENCLAGLTFVFTGLLQTLQREDGANLVKRYGGKVTGAPSKKTSFIVLGTDAGPSKLKKIQEFGLKTIDEDGLFELIRRLPAHGGDSKAAVKQAEKSAKEEEKLREQAALMEAEDKKAAAAKQAISAAKGAKGKENFPDTRLWTVKYAPTQMSQICGNKGQVEKLQRWLRAYTKNQSVNFKMPGPDGSGTFRAVIIHGPPGIGKTTAAHLVAKSEGYDVVESNASDTRSKKLVETGLKGVLDTRSLLGYFAGDGKEVEASKKKLCLIMDEVDGMSAGDRGGVGAMAAVCKKANIPIILICNDRKLPKMKPFDFVTYDLPFRRPTSDQIRGRIMTIMYREGMKLPPPVVNALIDGTGADIRQVVNMISTAKLDNADMDFESGKAMSKAWEKHVILKPWDITSKIMGGGMFAASSKSTLNDKIELYFNDHEFSYLMLQENYLNTAPIRAQHAASEKTRKFETLKLASQAADSISDGDLVDRMIHGSQQQWSLMPAHAVFSFVRPASFISGSQAYGGQTKFTSWLGQNSSQGKMTRLVKEIQGHMRLRTTGDRHEVRQQYMPVLWQEMVNRLQSEGKESVDEIIQLMDSYYLTRDDFDAIMELGVGPHAMAKVKIETQDKSAFTREYNKRDHPLPFIKASNVLAPKKLSKDKPDLEEALEESDEEEVIDIKEEEDDEEEVDLSKDKYVKQPKKKRAPAAKAKGGKKAKGGNDDGSEEEKPKRGKAKATRGKGKK